MKSQVTIDNQFFNLKILFCFVTRFSSSFYLVLLYENSSLYCPSLGLFTRESNILNNCGSKNLGTPQQTYERCLSWVPQVFLLRRVICLVVH